jgi:hypothetical protein
MCAERRVARRRRYAGVTQHVAGLVDDADRHDEIGAVTAHYSANSCQPLSIAAAEKRRVPLGRSERRFHIR